MEDMEDAIEGIFIDMIRSLVFVDKKKASKVGPKAQS